MNTIEYIPAELPEHYFAVSDPTSNILFSVYSDKPIDFERAKALIVDWRARRTRAQSNTSSFFPLPPHILLEESQDIRVRASPSLHPELQF
jgi:hypothetical protein